MTMIDDPKDVEQQVKQPVINSWTENDTPADGKKNKTEPKREKMPQSLHEVEERGAPGTGKPDAQETYRQGKQGPK